MDDNNEVPKVTSSLGHIEYVSEPDEDKEEELECRVCRSPEEDGRPLFSPCRCSGSIGLTHQDCLTSWLAVTRGEGRCELCKVKFQFAPQYADNAPDCLTIGEVLLGLLRRAVARWLPFLARLSFCVCLWLVIAPLSTSYLYLIWMNRSLHCVFERSKLLQLPADTVSGIVLAAIILISFLSLMSFADFLRIEWQQQQQHHQRRLDNGAAVHDFLETEISGVAEDNWSREHEVDNSLLEQFNRERKAELSQCIIPGTNEGDLPSNSFALKDRSHSYKTSNGLNMLFDVDTGDSDANRTPRRADNIDNDAIVGGDENHNNLGVGGNIVPHWRQLPEQQDDLPRRQQQAPRVGNHPLGLQVDAPGNNDMNNADALIVDDQADLEIQLNVEDLLGLRGPYSALLRNLLWLLVFNAVYLGIFAFIPKTIGSAVLSNVLNTTFVGSSVSKLTSLWGAGNSVGQSVLSFKGAVTDVNHESEKLNAVFRLPDFATISLGYLSCAAFVVVIWSGWALLSLCRGLSDASEKPAPQEGRDGLPGGGQVMNERERRVDVDDQEVHPPDGLENPSIGVGETVGVILDVTVSIVKVGILLFLKMFLLPLMLGVWLDGSSMDLFGGRARDHILYAGKDLFSFVLMHWVAGITFMLLVTVSVLQLREVVHADLLAHLIRPQEPQPDLLGNLMHDSVITQTKRMLLSLAIYTALLHLHVSIPAKVLLASGASNLVPFMELKFYHILMPQLQVPLELLVFHLSMLALLEKYKNSIGDLQHHWLVWICQKLGLAHYLLAHEVEKFSLVGSISAFTVDMRVNPVLYKLADGVGNHEDLILRNASQHRPDSAGDLYGETKESGERVLNTSQAYISLPSAKNLRGGDVGSVAFLPTKIGRYRLKWRQDGTMEAVIEVWKEVLGNPVPRPPEGWDDLGAGGADIQGRWAWGKERKSGIEKGIAQRSFFLGHSGKKLASLIARVLLLLLLSWCATTLLLVVAVSAPLGIGRLLYAILRVPKHYIHCPLGFAAGAAVCFPAVLLASSVTAQPADASLQLFWQWMRTFRRPPATKGTVLLASLVCWFVLCPFAVGLIYELFLVKAASWFSVGGGHLNARDLAFSWLTGTLLLNAWACLCRMNVFTREFWIILGNGVLEVEGERQDPERDENQAVICTDEDKLCLHWQGTDGKIASFFAALRAAFLRWEWDGVDHVVLLAECVAPVSRNLITLLSVPLLFCFCWFWLMDVVVGDSAGSHRLYVFRLASASTLLVQMCCAFRKQIQRWFGAVHKTARDDRYLIGEILLNYRP